MRKPLPIDARLEHIVKTVREHRAAVVVAPPGAGKTTRVPPALIDAGPVILLQPRRIAARALAGRIANERGWTVGKQVGWQVRFDRRLSERTRLLVATEGILTARLQTDPLLEGFRTVVIDEFHERTLHADLGLAMVRQAAAARDDLRVVVMSATLDAGPVAAFLRDCPVIEVTGRPYPVQIEHAPHVDPGTAVRRMLDEVDGHVLCFLPGAPEIRRLQRELASSLRASADLLPLHGSLDAADQDAALAPSARRKVVLATNIAETSLTVDGVRGVVDTGLHRLPRRDAASGIDRLETERIGRDSAEQRAGRAGRTGPGKALRLWDPRERLREHRDPEIERVDLARPFLQVLAWGSDPREFAWFRRPPTDATARAMELLELLGAVDAGKLTRIGRELSRWPIHPRLARVLLDASGSRHVAAACAVLAEGWLPNEALETSRSDLLALADRIERAPGRVRRAARSLQALAGGSGPRAVEEDVLLRAVLAAYPDRVARRREAGSPRLVLASGHGAVLSERSGVRDAEFLVALDLASGRRGPGSEATVRLASAVERDWVEPTRVVVEHEYAESSGTVRAFERRYHHGLLLAERDAAVDDDIAARILVDRLRERGLGPRADAVLRRLRFSGIEIDLDTLLHGACYGARKLPAIDLLAHLRPDLRRKLERLAPESMRVPSGRSVRLDYREDGSVLASVKLQEMFGLGETPCVGPERRPLTLALLAPNGRPVQTTCDLRGFWDRTYPEVRRELRGRYPKHPWPEDPWNAEPTARTKPRPR